MINENPSFQLPEGISFRNESFLVEISIEGLPDIATFDQETRTISLDYSQLTTAGSWELKFTLDDGEG